MTRPSNLFASMRQRGYVKLWWRVYADQPDRHHTTEGA